MSRIRFIMNPSAGSRQAGVEAAIRRALAGAGVAFDIVRTAYRGHGVELAREAVAAGVGLVVAVGGDGTLNEVGQGVLEGGAALGLVPYGSGNGFARAMGIPLDPAQACRALLEGEVRPIDVGKVGEAVFFSTAGFGLDAAVCRRYNQREGKRRGFWPYAALTLSEVVQYRPRAVEVALDDGTRLEAEPVILTAANTAQYGNGAIIAPGALPDDGVLEVCLIEGVSLPRALWHLPGLFSGRIDRMPGVRLFRAKSLRIARAEPGWFQVDGEALEGEAVLEVSLLPGAVRIALPSKNAT